GLACGESAIARACTWLLTPRISVAIESTRVTSLSLATSLLILYTVPKPLPSTPRGSSRTMRTGATCPWPNALPTSSVATRTSDFAGRIDGPDEPRRRPRAGSASTKRTATDAMSAIHGRRITVVAQRCHKPLDASADRRCTDHLLMRGPSAPSTAG